MIAPHRRATTPAFPASPRAPSLARLIGPEIRLLLRERALWLLLALLLLAMAVAARAGADRVRAEWAAIDASLHEEALARNKAADIAAGPTPPEQFRNPADPYGYLYYFLHAEARYAPEALAPLAAGAADIAPPSLSISPAQTFADGADGIANPLVARIGRFDLAFVLVFLLPLALIPMAGSRLSLERDRGQMPLLNAQPVPARRLALAKYAAVALVMLPVAVVGFWGAAALSGADIAAARPAMAGLSAAILLYGLFWIALAALVQRFRAGVAASLGSLTFLWATLGFLLPMLGSLILARTAPEADRTGQILAARAALARFDAEPEALTRRWLARVEPTLSPAERHDALARSDVRRLAQDALARTAVQPYAAAAQARRAFGERWANRLRRLSPPLLLDAAFQRAAGTDASHRAALGPTAERQAACIAARFQPLILHPERLSGAPPARLVRFERIVQACRNF